MRSYIIDINKTINLLLMIDLITLMEINLTQRFLPLEFGQDVDRHHAMEPVATVLNLKAKICKAIEVGKWIVCSQPTVG